MTHELAVKCPHCGTQGKIPVPESIHETRNAGISNVFVQEGELCPHSFLMFVDRKFKVRGYTAVDFRTKGGDAPATTPAVATPGATPAVEEVPLSPEEAARRHAQRQRLEDLFYDVLRNPGILSVHLLDFFGRIVASAVDKDENFEEISGVVAGIMNLGTIIGEKLKLESVDRFIMSGHQNNDAIVEKVGNAEVLVVVFQKRVKLGLINLEVKTLVKKIEELDE